MSKLYREYKWKNGIPYGISPVEDSHEKVSYKVVSDPYFKRISIEKYLAGEFSQVIYDSYLFDFRHLRATEQLAWEKTSLLPEVTQIRNQDDRLILIEHYTFEQNRCRLCQIHSPHGVFLAVQHMYYTAFNDPFNGVILFDINQHPVIQKLYEIDETSHEFTELKSESWDISLHDCPVPHQIKISF